MNNRGHHRAVHQANQPVTPAGKTRSDTGAGQRGVNSPGSPANLEGPRTGTNPDGVTPTELPEALRDTQVPKHK